MATQDVAPAGVSFDTDEETNLILQSIDDFIEQEVAPLEDELGDTWSNPRKRHEDDGRMVPEVVEALQEVRRRSAEAGFYAMNLPQEVGGEGVSNVTWYRALKHVASHGPGLHSAMLAGPEGPKPLLMQAEGDQVEQYLKPAVRGEKSTAFAQTEPGAGSDSPSMQTSAEKDGDEWVINGTKQWITNGTVGDYFVVLCDTNPDASSRYSGFSQIIVESDRDGFEADKITGKMGIRASDTAELIFNDVRVPEENLVGTRGAGFMQLMQFFDETRTMVAAQGVGIAKGAYERALEYAQEREQFGQAIGEFQAIQHKLADMATKTEAARQLTYKSAWSVENKDEQLTSLASMAKEFGSRVAVDVANEGVQIHGGSGYVNDFDAERFYRDAKITQIYEGTTEIQNNIIARELLGKGF